MRVIYINSLVVMIFMLINPLYALAFTAVISVITEKVNNLIIATLYVLSFSLLFANQAIDNVSDLGAYVDMYQRTEGRTILSIFNSFIESPHAKEALWLYFCMAIGGISSYNPEFYIFSTYMLIFGLSAYLAFLYSENGIHNFCLILFSIIFFNITLMELGYNLWRNIIASIIFLIGVNKYFLIRSDLKSRVISRIIIYSSFLVHIAVLPMIALFEIYAFFSSERNKYLLVTKKSIAKYFLFIFLSIFGIFFLSNSIYKFVINDPSHFLYRAFSVYVGFAHEFSFKNYLSPLYVMLGGSIVVNWKRLTNSDFFILAVAIIFEILLMTNIEMNMIFARASIATQIGIIFISIKIFQQFNYKYSVAFICLIFVWRMRMLINNMDISGSHLFIKEVGQGEIFNHAYGLLLSTMHFYNPIFIGYFFSPI